MAISFDTEYGALEWVDGRWQGASRLVDAIATWPAEDRTITPMGPTVDVDPLDEGWQYLQAMFVLDALGVAYAITARPPLPEVAPPGTVV
jgi:hypothetical protein